MKHAHGILAKIVQISISEDHEENEWSLDLP